MLGAADVRYSSDHGTLAIQRPATGIVVVAFSGRDTGEFGAAPFREIEKDIARHAPIDLFVDARHGRGASVDVSGEWARWLDTHKEDFRHVSMLTGSRFIQLSAEFVRKFAGLGDLMRIYADPAAFEGALAHAVANAANR